MRPGTTGIGAGRFAPSPSSELHLGNLRTAMLAWLFARRSGRAFVLRIEDLDRLRSADSDAVAAVQRADLLDLGLDFDPPCWWQSRRLPLYRETIASLGEATYECYCTRREIAEAASAPHEGFRPYPGTCARLSEAERAERRRARPAAIRIRADGARHSVTDVLHGRYTAVVDDFVLQRNDGTPAYNLAVVVDDAAGGIDQVVRGDDLLSSAPRQAWLTERLGHPSPQYAHVPLAMSPATTPHKPVRLAKRDGAVTMGELRAGGMSVSRVRSLLAASLGLAEPGEAVSMDTLLERFDPAALSVEPWIVDPFAHWSG